MMRIATVPLLIASAAAVLFVPLSSASLAADGQELFLSNNCNRCHSIERFDIEATVESERMKGPDLSQVGDERTAEWITNYVTRETELNGKKHRFPYKGSESDLATIAEWLGGLKPE